MIYRLEVLLRRLGRWTNRSRFIVWLFGLPKVPPGEAGLQRRGLIILQIDGLSHSQLQRAMANNSMPFTARLLSAENYQLHSLYSGVPSSTPAIQGELFYGVRNCVPAFKFKRPQDTQPVAMLDPELAAAVEQELASQAEPLLRGGSSHSNLFTGGAAEASFCASSIGWSSIVPTANLFKMVLFAVLNIASILRVAGLVVLEFGLALVDLLRGVFGGRDLFKELSFVPMRVSVSVLLRELVTIGVKIDATRGLPVIHANFLGFDEQAHRRGPQSRFAHWGLRGIDRAIGGIWRSAMRCQYREYDIWIYSDHGQQATVSYPIKYSQSIQSAVQRVLRQHLEGTREVISDAERSDEIAGNLEARHIHLLGSRRLSSWFNRISAASRADKNRDPDGAGERSEKFVYTEIAAMGPVGLIYLDLKPAPAQRDAIAEDLVALAHVPMVMVALTVEEAVYVAGQQQEVAVWTAAGKFHLPADKEIVLGADHPFLDAACDDLIQLCHHQYSGRWQLFGWQAGEAAGEPSLSLRIENGAHGGPGPNETHAFALLPSDAPLPSGHAEYLRVAQLREAALELLGRGDTAAQPVSQLRSDTRRESGTLRILTYNIHSCVGMDGKQSVARIARVIAQQQPDIVALQELEISSSTDEKQHQAHQIAQRLGMDIHFHPLQHVLQGRFGNAILTDLPMRLVKTAQLQPPASLRRKLGGAPFNEPRGALWVEIEFNGLPLNIITTHFGLTAKERRMQADVLMSDQWLDNPACRAPVVLCGDFNAVPTQPVCRRLRTVLNDAQTEIDGFTPLNTFAGRYPTVRIDHMFVDHDVLVKAVNVPRNSLTKVASDHLPLVVDLEFQQANQAHSKETD